MEHERDALETVADIRSRVEELPACSPRLYPLEELLEIWEAYDELQQRCERLLERRQRQLGDAERRDRLFGEKHARNEYLYGDLDTPYPVLSSLAEIVERIDENRTESGVSLRSNLSVES